MGERARERKKERRREPRQNQNSKKQNVMKHTDLFRFCLLLAHRNAIIIFTRISRESIFSWAIGARYDFGAMRMHAACFRSSEQTRDRAPQNCCARHRKWPRRPSAPEPQLPPLPHPCHLWLTTVSLPSMELITLHDARREPITFLYATERRLRSSTESSLGCCATAFMWSTISSKLNGGGRLKSAQPAEGEEGVDIKGLLSCEERGGKDQPLFFPSTICRSTCRNSQAQSKARHTHALA